MNNQHEKCLNDIAVARAYLKEFSLLPPKPMVEVYNLPSHNHPTFFACVFEKDGRAFAAYVKNKVYGFYPAPGTKMRSFYDCQLAAQHPAKQGEFIVGTVRLSLSVSDVYALLSDLPDKSIFTNGDTPFIDSVTRGVWVYGEKGMEKEALFHDSNKIAGFAGNLSTFFEMLESRIDGEE